MRHPLSLRYRPVSDGSAHSPDDSRSPRRATARDRRIARRRFEASLFGLLIVATPAVRADPIQPSYTVTDLGSSPTFSTGANGNGIVIASDGQTAYPFVQALAATPLTASQTASLPVPVAAPPVYGDHPFPNWSTATDAARYPNGIVVAVDQVIQNSNNEYQSYVPYYVQQNPDGSWGQPVAVGPGYTHYGPPIGGGTGVSLGPNSLDEILISLHYKYNYLKTY